MKSIKYFPVLATIGIASSILLTAPAFAQTDNATSARQGWGGRMGAGMGMHARGVFGTVSEINGNTLTITSKNRA